MKGSTRLRLIKSGGKTRRRRRLVILTRRHPDIVDYQLQGRGGGKAWALIDRAMTGRSPARPTRVFFQNSNNSVRVTDDFMRAVLDDGTWQTRREDAEPMDTFRARD